MPFFKSKYFPIIGKSYILRPPRRSDASAWIDLRKASEEHLRPFEPDWESDHLTMVGFKKYLTRIKNLQIDRRGEGYLIFRRDGNILVGAITLSNMRAGTVKSAWVGYWTGAPHANKGVMGEALSLLLDHVFENHNLNRVEAAILPDNIASEKLLQKIGFQYEGLARDYLHINGKFRSHKIYAILKGDPRISISL